MWIGIIIAIIVTVLFFSWGKNRNTPLQSKESTDGNYSGDGGSYDSSDDSDSSDGGDGGGDGGGGE
jgi:hypothetical protein